MGGPHEHSYTAACLRPEQFRGWLVVGIVVVIIVVAVVVVISFVCNLLKWLCGTRDVVVVNIVE